MASSHVPPQLVTWLWHTYFHPLGQHGDGRCNIFRWRRDCSWGGRPCVTLSGGCGRLGHFRTPKGGGSEASDLCCAGDEGVGGSRLCCIAVNVEAELPNDESRHNLARGLDRHAGYGGANPQRAPFPPTRQGPAHQGRPKHLRGRQSGWRERRKLWLRGWPPRTLGPLSVRSGTTRARSAAPTARASNSGKTGELFHHIHTRNSRVPS